MLNYVIFEIMFMLPDVKRESPDFNKSPVNVKIPRREFNIFR